MGFIYGIKLKCSRKSASFCGACLFGKGARSTSATNAKFIIWTFIFGRGHLLTCPAKSKSRNIQK